MTTPNTSPSPKARAARENSTKSTGPDDTSGTRYNAVTHGFTAALRPPEDSDSRRIFDELFASLSEEWLPCSRAEWLVLEEIVGLELRRIRIQEALMSRMDFGALEGDDPEGFLKQITLLSRYETETISKLEKKWKILAELQDSRARRRGLALEAALVQRQVDSLKQHMQRDAGVMAERALGREMADLAVPPEQAQAARRRVLRLASFRESPAAPGSSRDGHDSAPVSSPVPQTIPGPPWSPWHGASREELEQWNDELIDRKKAGLRAELERLENATDPPEQLDTLVGSES